MENDRPNAPKTSPALTTLVGCRICGQMHDLPRLAPGTVAHCQRCGSALERRTAGSLHLTAAFALSALILYIPANLFPILRMNFYGATSENTVWEGCVKLNESGDFLIALVVFMASIFIPLVKIASLFILAATCHFGWARGKPARTLLYHFVDVVGRWAMLDVFVLAVLVSVVKLQHLATIVAGSGLLAFTGVVIFTLMASTSFDPQLIWEDPEPQV